MTAIEQQAVTHQEQWLRLLRAVISMGGRNTLFWTQRTECYVEEAQEPSMIQGGKATGPLEASGIAGLG